MATQSAKASEIERKWYVVDAAGQPLGRLASKVAHVLRGKHRPEFTPHVDTRDFVYFACFCGFFLYANVLVLEVRRQSKG